MLELVDCREDVHSVSCQRRSTLIHAVSVVLSFAPFVISIDNSACSLQTYNRAQRGELFSVKAVS